MNFTEYWRNRKHEGDVEATKKTWTAKQVAQLGFTEIASVTEYHRQAGYTGVYATFLPKEVPINELRQEILKRKEEAEISLKSFHETGMGAERRLEKGHSVIYLKVR